MNKLHRLFTRKGPDGTGRKLSPFKLGAVLIVVTAAVGVVLFNKSYLSTTLRPGETIQVHFERAYGLRPYSSDVKVSWVPVGTVTEVERRPDGSAMVSVKVDEGTRKKLGSTPSAIIRPTTLLGGSYFVGLMPGGGPGKFSGPIPNKRTDVPVELDRVVRALQPSALDGLRSSVKSLDATLGNGGREAVNRLVDNLPATLDPAADVLAAARGQRPRTDLTNLVRGLESTAFQLSKREGQLDSIVTNLDGTASQLAAGSEELGAAIAGLPETLDTTNAGLKRLDTTLQKLRETAEVARPAVQQLDTALAHLDPVLEKTEPFVNRLKNVVIDARPVVERLVPASKQSTAILHDVQGPVLQRLNGPVKHFLFNGYKSEWPYPNTNSDQPMYKEIAGAVTNLDKVSSYLDKNGHAINIQLGVGSGTVAGLPVSAEYLLDRLFNRMNLQGPVEEGR